MLDGFGETALDCTAVEIETDHPVHPARGDHFGDDARSERLQAGDAPIVTGVAEVGNHGGHRDSPQPLAGVGHQGQLQEIFAGGSVERLHHEDFRAADVLLNVNVELPVGEALDGAAAEREMQLCGDLFGQGGVRRAGEQDGAHGDFFAHSPSP